MGSDEIWDKAEAALEQALKSMNISFDLQEGEGAFYGPKIEFTLREIVWTEFGNVALFNWTLLCPIASMLNTSTKAGTKKRQS